MLSAKPSVQILETVFNALFQIKEKTILLSGAEEPIYLPIDEHNNFNRIYSTKDYVSSALHEVSHWCLAGEKRRTLVDYGYWYEPDGRTHAQQLLFEQVEVKPQAIEWLFTRAIGQKFRLSVDNVNQPEIKPSEEFKNRVFQQAHEYVVNGLPFRAELFLNSLLQYFSPHKTTLSLGDIKRCSLD